MHINTQEQFKKNMVFYSADGEWKENFLSNWEVYYGNTDLARQIQ